MKKIIFASAVVLAALCLTSYQAQAASRAHKKDHITLKKLEGVNVSQMSKDQFLVDFGNMPNVKWKRSDNFDEATFQKKGQTYTAFYDDGSKLVGTTSYRKFSDIPAAGQKQINKDYKGYTIGKVLFFEDNNDNDTDMILYGNQFDDQDSYFVELSKGPQNLVVQVDMDGNVSYFQKL